jgi:hypothetical protein
VTADASGAVSLTCTTLLRYLEQLGLFENTSARAAALLVPATAVLRAMLLRQRTTLSL